jgi:hypothetical protein
MVGLPPSTGPNPARHALSWSSSPVQAARRDAKAAVGPPRTVRAPGQVVDAQSSSSEGGRGQAGGRPSDGEPPGTELMKVVTAWANCEGSST